MTSERRRCAPRTRGPRRASTTVLVPVKRLDQAKSRLAPLGEGSRRALARAFLLDTLDAATGSSDVARVLVVTEDVTVGEALRGRSGVRVVPGGEGLNEDLAAAAAAAREDDPRTRLLVLCADLPALRASDVDALLARHEPLVAVPDRHGVGTTALLCASAFEPRFGEASFAAHRAAGAQGLTEVGAGLRCDVDTPDDLAYARSLGLGRHTRAADSTGAS